MLRKKVVNLAFEKPSNSAQRLKQLMDERGLRQVDILNLCAPICAKNGVKMSKSSLSQYVGGTSIPDQHKLTVLGLALNVSEAWLMGYDVPMERQYTGGLTLSQVCTWIQHAATLEDKIEVLSTIAKSSGKEDGKKLLNNYIELLMK